MQRFFKTSRQKLNWTGWNKHIAKFKQSQKKDNNVVDNEEAINLTEIEIRIGRDMKAFHDKNSDYVDKDDVDITEYIEKLNVIIYSVYMNFESELMTYRQLDIWLSIYFSRFYSVITRHMDIFFIPHYMNPNIHVPSNIMIQLIDLATQRENLFRQSLNPKCDSDPKNREARYQQIKKQEDDIIKVKYIISYDPSIKSIIEEMPAIKDTSKFREWVDPFT